jgi:hypothetical protein
MIEKGFVTFLTRNSEQLTSVLLKSVLQFSKHPIVVCGVDYEPVLPFRSDQIICKQINNTRRQSIYYQKFNCILNSGIRNGVYVEGDDILNYRIDELFDECPVDNFPKAPKHPQDPDNQQRIMSRLNIQRKSQEYVHGHIIFSESCKGFIEECYAVCQHIGKVEANWDETVLNVLLWKYGRTDTATKYVFDPYYDMYRYYLAQEHKETDFLHGYKGLKLAYHMIHGSKNPQEANMIFERLKAVRNQVYYEKV